MGLQSHITLKYSEQMLEGVRENMRRLGELGLVVHITELDVKCSSEESCSDWTEEMEETQASIYEGLLTICLEEASC